MPLKASHGERPYNMPATLLTLTAPPIQALQEWLCPAPRLTAAVLAGLCCAGASAGMPGQQAACHTHRPTGGLPGAPRLVPLPAARQEFSILTVGKRCKLLVAMAGLRTAVAR
jgi:hypothetical protein